MSGTATILTERAPVLALPLRFFLLGVLALIALLGISMWKAPLLAMDYVHNSATLAVTHLFTLGFGGLILTGAIYQLTPVVLHSRPPKAAAVNLHLVLQFSGLVAMVVGFLQLQSAWVIVGGSLVMVSGITFAANLVPTFRRAENWNWHGYLIVVAVLFYLSTLTWGLVMGLNMRYGFISGPAGAPLAAHLALGLGGWFTLAVLGVGTKLVPLFAPSKPLAPWFVASVGLSLIAGVLTLVIGLFTWSHLVWAGALLMTTAVLGYTGAVGYTISRRRGKALCFSSVFAGTAASLVSAIALTALAGLAGIWDSLYVQAGLACLFMLGWVGGTILGMLLKILPFMVWLHRFRSRLHAEERIPFIHQMFDPVLGWVVYVNWFVGSTMMAAGYALSQGFLISAGAILSMIGLVTFGWIVGQVLRQVRPGSPALFPNFGHKRKPETAAVKAFVACLDPTTPVAQPVEME